MTVLIIATLILIINLLFEYFRHTQNVKQIPVRIHVNGTRGKSSVTRLIAAGLRAGGIRTLAKTTGTMPRVILPDGRESSIVRLFGPNIIEQKYIFRYAASLKPQAIVVECMAVNPVFQWITERKFIKSTVSVITNVRLDHLDLMGSTIQSVARSICNTIPSHKICFTAEREQFPLLKQIAHHRGTKISGVSGEDISQDDLKPFGYIEHADNLALALSVCDHFGVKRDVALKGMQNSNPDPGALQKYTIQTDAKQMIFYNVFAANDPSSSLSIWKMIIQPLEKQQRMIILNTRADRYDRSKQLIETFREEEYDYFVLTGEKTEALKQYALDGKIPKGKLIVLGEIDPSLVYDRVLSLTIYEAHIVGIGNIAGTRKYGAHLVNYFRKKSQGGF
jgi:poly-gamma-glutamate synthase PgsB/CapB